MHKVSMHALRTELQDVKTSGSERDVTEQEETVSQCAVGSDTGSRENLQRCPPARFLSPAGALVLNQNNHSLNTIPQGMQQLRMVGSNLIHSHRKNIK